LQEDPDVQKIAEFLFEAGMLSKTPRTGYRFLGTGRQSVAEHLFRTTVIGYVLSRLEPGADTRKLLTMCLLHDFAEARTGDQNYVYKKYVDVDEERALEDLAAGLPFGDEIKDLVGEFNEQTTREALLTYDADQLELLVQLKEEQDLGNTYAQEWLRNGMQRLKTDVGRSLASVILTTDFTDWWFKGEKEEWWVNGK